MLRIIDTHMIHTHMCYGSESDFCHSTPKGPADLVMNHLSAIQSSCVGSGKTFSSSEISTQRSDSSMILDFQRG